MTYCYSLLEANTVCEDLQKMMALITLKKEVPKLKGRHDFFRNISLNKFDFSTAFFERIRVRVIYSPHQNQFSQCIKKCLCMSDIIGLKAVTINII